MESKCNIKENVFSTFFFSEWKQNMLELNFDVKEKAHQSEEPLRNV